MEKSKLLSKAEMKKVLGGREYSCSSSNECPGSQGCCSDYSNPTMITYSCEPIVQMILPDGSSTGACASFDPPL